MRSLLAVLLAALVVAVGTAWALQRGGQDFDVFHAAGRLVAEGRGAVIYRESPDRYLYAPGFAWAVAPFAWLPRGAALGLLCALKAALLGLVASQLGRRALAGGGRAPFSALGLGGSAIVFCAHPILIDFRYGQVNLVIALLATAAALRFHLEHARGRSTRLDVALWAALGFLLASKPIALPLLLLPFARALRRNGGTPAPAIAAGVGLALAAALPLPWVGFDGLAALWGEWAAAIRGRGLPLEAHNQSWAAWVARALGGASGPVLYLPSSDPSSGDPTLAPWGALIGEAQVAALALGGSLVALGYWLAWLASGSVRSSARWAAVAVGLAVLPLHLVWKSYFVFTLPLAAFAILDAWRAWEARAALRPAATLFAVFALLNLVGPDWLGERLAARLEPLSPMLLAHLVLLTWVAASRPVSAVSERRRPRPARTGPASSFPRARPR